MNPAEPSDNELPDLGLPEAEPPDSKTSVGDLPARDLLPRARAGDAAARAELHRRTLAALGHRLGGMAERLCNHTCVPFTDTGSAPASPDALETIGMLGIAEAIATWDCAGDWGRFSVSCVASAMWRAVAASFEARTHTVAQEVLKNFKAPPETRVVLAARLPEVVAQICSTAFKDWLMRARPMVWEAYVLSHVDDHFRAIAGELAGPNAVCDLTDLEMRGIIGIARKGARRFTGVVNESLAQELEQIAVEHVARALPRFNPAVGPRIHFVLLTAKRAVLDALDVVRSHNLSLLWWIVQEAMDDFRSRMGGEPEIEDIVAALDPAWVRGERKEPRYSPSLIRKVITMYSFGPQNDGAGPAKAAARKLMQQLALRAGLKREERAILDLRLDDLSHRDIAVKLGISPARSRKVYHRTMKRLAAVARGITAEERSVVQLLVCEEKTEAKVARALGIPVFRVRVLWHFAVEHLLACPAVHARVAKEDWPVLSAALQGYSHAEISRDSGIPDAELPALLRRTVAKLRCVRLPKRRS